MMQVPKKFIFSKIDLVDLVFLEIAYIGGMSTVKNPECA